MKAIILAAGYATRLYPLTKETPKSLLVIDKKPIIEHILDKIELIDEIDLVYVAVNNKFYEKFKYWAEQFNCNKKIIIVNDGTNSNEDKLGAIGDILFAVEKENIKDDLLIISGDNLFNFNLKNIHNLFKEKRQHIISLYHIKTIEEIKKLSEVVMDENNKIIEFKEKPENPKSTFSSIGIYFYTKSIIESIKQYIKEGNSPDRPGDLLEWLHKREDVYGFVFDSLGDKWFDIGSFESLEEAGEYYK